MQTLVKLNLDKWIRSRRLAAQRTAGGHYRIAPTGYCLRCWEYFSCSVDVSAECTNCVVYRVRAAWCFEVLGVSDGAGHARAFCGAQGSCTECAYYQRVYGTETRVLVITADSALKADLERETSSSVTAHFASDGYEASTLIATLRPAFVVLDSRGADRHDEALVGHLLNDVRAPGLKVILDQKSLRRARHLPPGVIAAAKAPLRLSDIAALVASFPVQRKLDANCTQSEPPTTRIAPAPPGT